VETKKSAFQKSIPSGGFVAMAALQGTCGHAARIHCRGSSRPQTVRRQMKESEMAVVFVEARPKGRKEDEPITDFVVEDHADHVLAMCKTQEEAIAWAKEHHHTPHVARVRHLNDKKQPDHWREV
jgi:hypothetical protein